MRRLGRLSANWAAPAVRAAAVLVATGCAANVAQPTYSQGVAGQLALSHVERQMIAAALDSIAAHLPDSTALCLTLMGGPDGPRAPGDDLLATLHTRQTRVRGADCPPTYTRMIQCVDSLGRPIDPPPPAGYVDPYVFHVGRPQFEHLPWSLCVLPCRRQLDPLSGNPTPPS